MINSTRKKTFKYKNWLILAISLILTTSGFAQQLLVGGNMESNTGWTVYHLGGAAPATYQFNYTAQKPANGKDGCLRVTSTQTTNVLFWQKVTLKGGKSYVIDGALKTGTVQSFWCELYLSTVAPVAGVDYSPNGNGDVVIGLSTWAGCGPNLDGIFSKVACSGKRVYKAPGAYNQDVEVYFALKTGSSAAVLPAPLEVLIDELNLSKLDDAKLLSTQEGIIDPENLKVTNVSPFISVVKFRAGLRVANTASLNIIGQAAKLPVANQNTTIISDTIAVQIKGSNDTINYPIELRGVYGDNDIIATSLGSIDAINLKVIDLPVNANVAQLKSILTVSSNATFKILIQNNEEASNQLTLNTNLHIEVTAENGSKKSYAIEVGGASLPAETLSNSTNTVEFIKNKILTVEGSVELHITANEKPLEGSLLNLKSDDIWIYFDNIKPSIVSAKYLSQILINDQAAVIDQNVRLVQYLQGTVIISHSASYKPLEAFTGENLSGTSQQFGVYTYHRAAELGSMNNAIKSFKLKKGYTATFAQNGDGTGYSKVYIADRNDVLIDSLPFGLYDSVSFVRVIPWRWATKKGWTSGRESADALNCSWQYDWNNEATSSLDVEYIPMRHNRYWNGYENINNKKNSTHALGFNEPDRTDQSNMPVGEALDRWPELLKSGLRLGSPSPSDGGLNWLFEFMDKADALNYRVDYVAIHWYQGGQTPRQLYDRLKWIHDRTKRPLWVTEWNNGANWTCCKPTYASQATAIAGFLQVLDTTSFVERYSLYEWVEDTRQMFYEAPNLLTPAGIVYRDKISPMAYNPAKEFSHEYVIPAAPAIPPTEFIGAKVGFDLGKTLSLDIDNDGDLDIIYNGIDPTMGGVLKNDGQGNYTSTGQSIQGLFISSMNGGDIDGDGDMDVILSGWDKDHGWGPYSRILRNDGTGLFTLETPPSVNAPTAGFGDFDNNGLLDYYMIGNGVNNNKFYFQKPGGFDPVVNKINNTINFQDTDATTVDYDNDQDVDFCIEAYNKTSSRRYTQIWKNDGKGNFAQQAIPFKQKHYGSSQFADIDSDGDLDMLLNGDGDANSDAGSSDVYRLYINNGAGGFTEGVIFEKYRQNANGKGSGFVDWDNDGDYDIILTGASSTEGKEVTNIYLNNGAGVFAKSPESSKLPGINKGGLELGDANNDGKIDLFLTGYSGSPYVRNVAFLIKNTTEKVNTKPVAPSGLQAIAKGDSVQFSWSAGSDAETNVKALTYNIYVKNDNGKFFIFPNANIATGKRMLAGLGNAYQNLGWYLKKLPKGTYTWSIQTIDASYAGSEFAPAGTFVIRPNAPTNLQIANVTDSTADVFWVAPLDKSSVAGYNVYVDSILVNATAITDTTYRVSGLSSSTSYTFTVKSRNKDGYESLTGISASVTTPDTQAPSAPGVPVTVSKTDSTITFTWPIAVDNVGVTGYLVYQDTVLLTVQSIGNTSYTAVGLNAGTSYSFTVKAIDLAGNISASSEPLLETTTDSVKPSAPGNLTSIDKTDSTVTLSWDASTDNVGIVGYDVYKNGILVNTEVVTGLAYTVTGLKASTTYAFTIKAKDKANNASVPSATLNVTTPDTQAPSAPTNLTSSKKPLNKVEIKWHSASDNVGVKGYNFYRDGVKINTALITTTSYVTDRPKWEDVYEFTTTAVDAAGNESVQSESEFVDRNVSSSTIEFVQIYPNPNDGQFKLRVKSKLNGPIVITIYDWKACAVNKVEGIKDSETYQKDYNLPELRSGIYSVFVKIGNNYAAKLLIVYR